MEKFVFKEFMKYEVPQSTVIFADAFNLNIEGWSSSNTAEHPYRIVFYNSGMIVGFIDAVVNETSKYINTDMPFVLFTPFGKITGHFSTHFKLFNYSIENRRDSFEKIEGLFEVKRHKNLYGGEYQIASTLTLENSENNKVQVSFNEMASDYIIEITKETDTNYEKVRLDLDANLIIEHFVYPKFNERRNIARIKLELKLSKDAPTLLAIFEFLDRDSYHKDIEISNELFKHMPYEKRLGDIDFNVIGEEITENDPRMFAFIDEVREALTLLANGTTPVSIYDKIAQLCFHEESDKFKLDFTRAQSVKTALTHNFVLKKMDSKPQDRKPC